MARGKVHPWRGIPGGYVRQGVYGIRRTIRGRTYERSLYASTEAAALERLADFERDPDNWHPVRARIEPVFLDADLVREFLAWSKEKGNTLEWRIEQKRVLGWWADELAGVDLRRTATRDPLVDAIKPALRKATSRPLFIRVLKTFCAWLRTEKHLLDMANDPVAGRLVAPAPTPAQWTKSKVVSLSDLEKAFDHLAPHYRDALEVLLGTGWHVSELARFARAGTIAPLPPGREAEGAAVLETPRTKRGNPHRVPVTERVAAAARRLRDRGELSKRYLRRAIAGACRAAKVDPFNPGAFRHTVATFAEERGAIPESVAAFLNHASKATTDRFYATTRVPPKVPTPR